MFGAKTGLAALAALAMTGLAFAEAEPGFVKGTVTDAAGKPLAGVFIFIDGVLDQNMQYTTREDGAYRLRLQPGAYVAMASMTTKWEGQTYKFDLKPDTTDTFDDSTGAVRNFTWTLTGERPQPQMGSYAGYIYVNVGSEHFFVEDQDNFTWTLEPVGPLIDGSTGETLTRRGGAPRTPEYGKILDVPVGKYAISGIYHPPGRKPQTLKFKNSWARGEQAYVEKLEILILAEGNFCNLCASVDVESPTEPQPE